MKFLRVTGFLALSACLLLLLPGCGDYYRPVANPVVSPGGQPQTEHYAWVVNFNPTGPGSTTEIDVSGDTNLAVNSMGNGSIVEAFPTNSLALYVANSTADSVSEYLPTLAGSVTTINLLPGSHPVALISTTNTNMYVLNSGSNSACPTAGSISTIVTSTLTVSNTTCVGHNPIAMAQSVSNNYIYAINQADNSVSVFNPAGPGIVGTITSANGLGLNPVSATASLDGNWIFIVTRGDDVHPGALDIVSTSATSACPSLSSVCASEPLGVGPTYSIIDTNLNRLYVANTIGNTVSVFDSSTVNPSSSPPIPLLATVSVGTNPIGITPLLNGTLFYVLNSTSNDVTVVSANSFSPLTSVVLPVGADPVFIASDPTSAKVYVADQGTTETTIIQTSNNTISANIAAPSQIIGCTVCALQVPQMIVTK
jgi:DNA-binding beta-propeller fold protein YncE